MHNFESSDIPLSHNPRALVLLAIFSGFFATSRRSSLMSDVSRLACA